MSGRRYSLSSLLTSSFPDNNIITMVKISVVYRGGNFSFGGSSSPCLFLPPLPALLKSQGNEFSNIQRLRTDSLFRSTSLSEGILGKSDDGGKRSYRTWTTQSPPTLTLPIPTSQPTAQEDIKQFSSSIILRQIIQ